MQIIWHSWKSYESRFGPFFQWKFVHTSCTIHITKTKTSSHSLRLPIFNVMDLELFHTLQPPPIIIPYLSGGVSGMYVCALIFFNGIRCIGKFSRARWKRFGYMRRAIMKVALGKFVIRMEVVEYRVDREGETSHHYFSLIRSISWSFKALFFGRNKLMSIELLIQ